jgi:hypothetical protein
MAGTSDGETRRHSESCQSWPGDRHRRHPAQGDRVQADRLLSPERRRLHLRVVGHSPVPHVGGEVAGADEDEVEPAGGDHFADARHQPGVQRRPSPDMNCSVSLAPHPEANFLPRE